VEGFSREAGGAPAPGRADGAGDASPPGGPGGPPEEEPLRPTGSPFDKLTAPPALSGLPADSSAVARRAKAEASPVLSEAEGAQAGAEGNGVEGESRGRRAAARVHASIRLALAVRVVLAGGAAALGATILSSSGWSLGKLNPRFLLILAFLAFFFVYQIWSVVRLWRKVVREARDEDE